MMRFHYASHLIAAVLSNQYMLEFFFTKEKCVVLKTWFWVSRLKTVSKVTFPFLLKKLFEKNKGNKCYKQIQRNWFLFPAMLLHVDKLFAVSKPGGYTALTPKKKKQDKNMFNSWKKNIINMINDAACIIPTDNENQ